MSSQEAIPVTMRAFAQGYGHAISADSAASVSTWLHATLAAASERWPQIALDSAVFAHDLGRRFTHAGLDLKLASSLHSVDLFLACACALNVPHAASTFDRDYLQGVAALLRHIDASSAFAEEVRQCLRDKLLVAAAGEAPRIASYTGRGPLANWIAVAAQREALSLKRASGRRQRVADEHAASMFPSARDPELVYMKERYRNEFQDAFRIAIADLPDRDRVVLRFNLVEHLSTTKIGAMYGVNQSTVTRWIARSREQVIERMLQIFRERMGLGQSDFESVVRLVQSEIDLNVSQLLSDVAPQP
ncbi:MAG TPA: sigma-70 family RNA polymerase sigma factor [Polyangiaceae bacterium]|jgi:RNA polymerase sigma-70 factor (ECF subfamily)|nr:sigma-70 family RNA polymerase sigma factor [Polyangiaceae bacterium]